MATNVEFDMRWFGAYIARSQWHFHRQLRERYGVVLGVGEFTAMLRDIRSGRAQLICMKGKAGRVYAVRAKGYQSRVYVLAVGGFPRTAWPREDAERWLDMEVKPVEQADR